MPRRRYTHLPALRCSRTCRCTVLPITANTVELRGGDYRRRVRQTPQPRLAMKVAIVLKTAMNRVWSR